VDDCGEETYLLDFFGFLVTVFGVYLAVAALVKQVSGAGKYSYLHLRRHELK